MTRFRIKHAKLFTITGTYLGTQSGRVVIRTMQRGFEQVWRVRVEDVKAVKEVIQRKGK